jgi:hypothetical protein
VTAKLPTYCPLTLSFDGARLCDELLGLRSRFDSLATTKANLDKRKTWFPVGDEELYAQVDHVAIGPGPEADRMVVRGKVPSWSGIGLTHVPGRPETSWGSSRFRRGFDGKWAWKEDLEVPYTRQLVGGLGLQRVDNVRVMTLPEGGLGPTHVDWETDDPWESEGLASITFLLRDGGSPMRFKSLDGKLYDVNDAVFFFKDCVPHGTPRTTSERLLLRVNGAMDRQRLRSLMRFECAIW